ncbi:MAG: flavin-dependent oxidoreductase [Sedimentitalea sp.]
MTVLIAGAGIAGLTLGLTLHQIGVPFQIFESARAIEPLGVGINIQPNAVRELFELGLEPELEKIGVRTRQLGFYTKYGATIWEEPRGTWGGYAWPQYSVHRGKLQVMLYQTLCARAGADCVINDARVTGFETGKTATLLMVNRRAHGELLIAADGIHSAIRAQMYPEEGAPIWNGRVLWRATTQADVFFGGAAMAMIGHDNLRVVAYPITHPAPVQNQAEINWIAEKRFDPSIGWSKDDWNKSADTNAFLSDFADWHFDWINVPELISGARQVLEYPMVDRDPLPSWTDGRVSLMGDAAHPTYPVGSNGASQAIIDARVIGAKLLEHGMTPQALSVYEADMRPSTTAVGLANRGSGPDAVMQWVEDRCGGVMTDINDVISQQELAAHAAKYKSVAGISIETLNASPPILPRDAAIN